MKEQFLWCFASTQNLCSPVQVEGCNLCIVPFKV